MNLTLEQTKHIAKLAALELSEAEQAKYTEQFQEILSYIDKLSQVDTSKVEVTLHPIKLPEPFREDKINNSRQLPRKEILGEKEYFEV